MEYEPEICGHVEDQGQEIHHRQGTLGQSVLYNLLAQAACFLHDFRGSREEFFC